MKAGAKTQAAGVVQELNHSVVSGWTKDARAGMVEKLKVILLIQRNKDWK